MSERPRMSGLGGMARMPVENSRVVALALGALFMSGGALGALTLLLPHPAAFDDQALWSNVALAFVAGALIALLARGFPKWALQIVLALGTIVISRAVYFSMEPSGYYAFYYIWVAFFAFFFF